MPSSQVLLTGGNGFIAVHILELLLQHGHIVTTTVRSESKTTYLRQKFSEAVASGQLKFAIVKDITSAGAFNEVVKSNSFDTVLHTSSPFVFDVQDTVKDLLEPAIQGTTEVLKSVKEYGPTVKRVVITSSFASVVDPFKGDRPEYVYTDRDWNPTTFDIAKQNPIIGYYGSKALAEKAAWDFVESEKPSYDLVTICPPFVYGPALQEVTSLDNLNTSNAEIYQIFNGQVKELKNSGVWVWVDVRDVAKAHVAALEKPEAAGKRFIVSEGTYNIAQIVDYIWKHYPERAQAKGIPKSTPGVGYPPTGTYSVDNGPSKDVFGINYIPFNDMLKDQLAQFVTLEKTLGVY